MNKLNIKMNNFDIKEWRYKQALQELSDKQKQIAQAAPPTDKITGADFKALIACEPVIIILFIEFKYIYY